MLPSCLEFFKYADPELAPGRSGTSSLRSFSLDDAFSNPCTPQTPESFAWHDGGILTDCELTNARQERTTDLGVKILVSLTRVAINYARCLFSSSKSCLVS